MRYVVVAALAALVASAAPVAAQSTGSANGEVAAPTKPAITKDSTGRILGVLDADTGSPVVGAEVIDKITGVTAAMTNGLGIVRLGSFRSQHDSSVVTVRKIGYQDTTFLAIQSDTTPITLMLEATAPVLPAMLTEAVKNNNFKFLSSKMQEFMSRATDKSLHGIFVGPDEMRSVALGGGVLLAGYLASKGAREVTPECRGGTIDYLDGRYAGRGFVSGYNLEAAEYYSAADVPTRFKMPIPSTSSKRPEDTAACGVLILWSREKA